MRKLTVLLLSAALLAITGGASVARADGFAILQCSGGGAPTGFFVFDVDTSFDTPAECALGESCSKCAHAITEEGLKLADSNLSMGNLDAFQTRMVFAESDDDDDDDD
jgi:hypothetical protein